MRKIQTQIGVVLGLALLLAGSFVLLTQAAQARYPTDARPAAQVPPDQSTRQHQPSGPVDAATAHPPANPAVVLYDQLDNIGTANARWTAPITTAPARPTR
jgi:hypothetical protein